MLWRDWRLETGGCSYPELRPGEEEKDGCRSAWRRGPGQGGAGQLRRTQRQHLKLLNLCSLLAPARAHLAQSL